MADTKALIREAGDLKVAVKSLQVESRDVQKLADEVREEGEAALERVRSLEKSLQEDYARLVQLSEEGRIADEKTAAILAEGAEAERKYREAIRSATTSCPYYFG